MPFDTIVFDLDGTLVDTADDLTASLNHALGVLGRPSIDPRTVRSMVGHGARKLLERGLAATGEMTPELVEADARAAVDNLAATARLRLRPVYGSQDSAFAAALPLGLVLPKHIKILAELREKL